MENFFDCISHNNSILYRLRSLGPGASRLIQKTDLDPNRCPKELSIEDFVKISRVYHSWPHKQYIDDITIQTVYDVNSS
jgi:hypothetical protein